MDHALGKRMLWEIRTQVRRASWPTWLGIGLLALAVVIHALIAQPALHKAESIERDAKRLLAEAATRQSLQPQNTDADRLSHFYQHLPANDALPTWLKALSQSADSNGIPFHQGDYRYLLEKDGKFGRYIVDLSLQGSYPALRGFLAEILDTMPFAAIEDLTISRDSISNENLEVHIRIALYFSSSQQVQPR